jgi:transcriptional regulator with XRE-family HTH domain
MSQRQMSGIIGIGTSFISQIETGKDPMPAYIPDKLAEVFGQDEVDKYQKSTDGQSFSTLFQRRYLFSPRAGYQNLTEEGGLEASYLAGAEAGREAARIDRVLDALERRDELAFLQQREYEKQGVRIDELLAILKVENVLPSSMPSVPVPVAHEN